MNNKIIYTKQLKYCIYYLYLNFSDLNDLCIVNIIYEFWYKKKTAVRKEIFAFICNTVYTYLFILTELELMYTN